ncbi:hypothetical protein TNIN_338221 [Trichonephila inaurata madagascariensis]|uniref:Uncharacterized protein n=1 Tax=Trichonephila inaurata madagascariensis TaxID=2747483 RepID=A0A8X6MCR7_9ARAC|nr:hypothetical protein TNIN_338221 [Trichonephila inaurata madagascariensis]
MGRVHGKRLFSCCPDRDGENKRSLLEDLVMRRNSVRGIPRENFYRWELHDKMDERSDRKNPVWRESNSGTTGMDTGHFFLEEYRISSFKVAYGRVQL